MPARVWCAARDPAAIRGHRDPSTGMKCLGWASLPSVDFQVQHSTEEREANDTLKSTGARVEVVGFLAGQLPRALSRAWRPDVRIACGLT